MTTTIAPATDRGAQSNPFGLLGRVVCFSASCSFRAADTSLPRPVPPLDCHTRECPDLGDPVKAPYSRPPPNPLSLLSAVSDGNFDRSLAESPGFPTVVGI